MTDAEWEAEIEGERVAKERFHAMRKHTHSRRVRQAAWAEVERFRWRRIARSMRMHPIAPSLRWWDFNDSSPEGWTYPAFRTLEPEEVDELRPGARAAFAVQCDDIPRSRFIFDRHATIDGKLRISVPQTPPGTKHINTTWIPEMGIWRRYHTFVKSKPHQPAQAYSVVPDSQVWR